jgi:hypothetical protein
MQGLSIGGAAGSLASILFREHQGTFAVDAFVSRLRAAITEFEVQHQRYVGADNLAIICAAYTADCAPSVAGTVRYCLGQWKGIRIPRRGNASADDVLRVVPESCAAEIREKITKLQDNPPAEGYMLVVVSVLPLLLYENGVGIDDALKVGADLCWVLFEPDPEAALAAATLRTNIGALYP